MDIQWTSIEERIPPRDVWLFTRLGEKEGGMRTFSQEHFFKDLHYDVWGKNSAWNDGEAKYADYLKEMGYTHWQFVNDDLIDEVYK